MTTSSTSSTTLTAVSTGSAGTISFGTLSGLDTNSLITAEMAIAKIPQQQLQTKLTSNQAQITALQALNTSIAALSTSATSLISGNAWTQQTATSTNSAVTVTAASSAAFGSINLTVNNVATSASTTLAPGSTVAADSAFTIYGNDGTALAHFSTDSTPSLTEVAAAINATSSSSNVRAVVSNSDAGPMLQIVSTQTGDVSNFDITNDADGTSLIGGKTTSGIKASLLVNGQTLTSDSNTLDIAPGVSVTLGADAAKAGANTSTITVSSNDSARASALSSFINQVNSIITTIQGETKYGTTQSDGSVSTGGVLAGNASLRGLATTLMNAVFPSTGSQLNGYGISITDSGTISFDQSAFIAAYKADPAGTNAAIVGTGTDANGLPLTDNFVSRLQKVADQSIYSAAGANTSPYTKGDAANFSGVLVSLMGTLTTRGRDLSDQIDAWTTRLAAKQTSLQTYWNSFTATMNKITSQSTLISGIVDSLDNASTKSK